MNLLDTSAWLEFFTNGKNAHHFQKPIALTGKLIVPTIVLYETFKKLLMERSENVALEYVGYLTEGQVVDLNMELALLAGKISVEQKLAMADSIILATAQKYGATVWTQDSDFKGLKGVKYFS